MESELVASSAVKRRMVSCGNCLILGRTKKDILLPLLGFCKGRLRGAFI